MASGKACPRSSTWCRRSSKLILSRSRSGDRHRSARQPVTQECPGTAALQPCLDDGVTGPAVGPVVNANVVGAAAGAASSGAAAARGAAWGADAAPPGARRSRGETARPTATPATKTTGSGQAGAEAGGSGARASQGTGARPGAPHDRGPRSTCGQISEGHGGQDCRLLLRCRER
eukprot:1961505-Pyramimonas_sp.AAC.1